MKKIALSLGAIAMTSIPLTMAISCGNDGQEKITVDLDDSENKKAITEFVNKNPNIHQITKLELSYTTKETGTIGMKMEGKDENDEDFKLEFYFNIIKIDISDPSDPIMEGSIWWKIDDEPKVEIAFREMEDMTPQQEAQIEEFSKVLNELFGNLNIDSETPILSSLPE